MGVKYLYSLSVVCFTVLCIVDCESSSSSVEEETAAAESLDVTKSYDDDNAPGATHVGDGGVVPENGGAATERNLKRFIVPVSNAHLGLETPGNRPYFTHHQQQQRYHHHHQQPQQQQHRESPQQHRTHQYHAQGRGPAVGHFGFGPSAGNGGGNAYAEQSDGLYQSGGAGGENVGNFDATGFKEFAPSVGFRSPVSPSPPPPSPFTASQQLPFDDGPSGHLSFDPTGFSQESPSAGYGGGYSSGGGGYDNGPHHQTPVVYKSVYVHVAPPDDEPPRKQRVIFPDVPPKKNYQIVFIKAPTAPPLVAPVIPPPPQHSEKTLIYVLHPKPEEAPPIHIPAPPVAQPIKPEVYFIKYKNREESHGGGGDYGHGGALPAPGEEFGGGDGGHDGYPHRRYGRGHSPRTPSQLPTDSSSTASPTTGHAVDDETPERRDRDGTGPTAADEDGAALAATADRTSVERTAEELYGGGDYSNEYGDASVESSNLSVTHVTSAAVPKGKNGH